MPKKKSSAKRRSGCPLNASVEMLGDRWSLLIIRDMMLRGSKTYKEFLEGFEGIATNILAERLRRFPVAPREARPGRERGRSTAGPQRPRRQAAGRTGLGARDQARRLSPHGARGEPPGASFHSARPSTGPIAIPQ